MPNLLLMCPNTQSTTFGMVGEMNSRGEILPAGPIRLHRGKHIGPNHGFGARHIWAEHASEMSRHGLLTEGDVPAYVSLIIQSGVPIYHEGGRWGKPRVAVVKSLPGTAILEYRGPIGMGAWAVVTAYSSNKKHGILVGSVL